VSLRDRWAPRKRFFWVGSDSKVAEAVTAVLPGWGMAHAANNRIALEMLRARAYNLVLTGEETSGQQDVELLRQIRTVRSHVRLIVITSESTPADVIAMRERAFSYFSKPYYMSAFEQMLLHEQTNHPLGWPAWRRPCAYSRAPT
jgi:DNA-binding NtrC family response regulator